jgi:hypothetical protein
MVTVFMDDGSRAPVHRAEWYKYLGVKVDWMTGLARGSKLQIMEATKTAKVSLITLAQSGATELPIDMVRKMHLTFNLPRITYGLGIVICDSTRIPGELMTIERAMVRMMTRAPKKCPIRVMYSVLGGKLLQGTVAAQQVARTVHILQLPRHNLLRMALSAQTDVWVNRSTSAAVRSRLHVDTIITLMQRIDNALEWNDKQVASGSFPSAPYNSGRLRNWRETVLSTIRHYHCSSLSAAGLTIDEEQSGMAKMAADSRAAVYILSLHQHNMDLAVLTSIADVAWMSHHIVGAPFTATRRSYANQLRVQVRGGMRTFLPWKSFQLLRDTANGTGCWLCKGDMVDGKAMWTVTHLLKTCMFDELEAKRQEVWKRVVQVATETGLAGAQMLANHADYNNAYMRDNMYALMVGEEVPNDFINLGLQGWRARKVAHICRPGADSTSGARNGDKAHSVGIFTDDHSGPENGRIHKKQLIGDDGRNEGGGVHGNDHRHDATTTGNKPTATQISTYQRLLNITGGMLVFASNYAQDCIAITSGNYETGPLRA